MVGPKQKGERLLSEQKGDTTPAVDWRSLDDAVLVKAFVKGDQTAFEVLFKKYNRHVARLVYSVIRTPDLVEDTVQEVFLLVYRNLHKFRQQSAFKTWLYRITVNESLRQISRAQRWQPLPEQEAEPEGTHDTLVSYPGVESPERMLLQGERKALVQEGLGQLNPNQKLILSLYYMEDLSIQEISEVLSIPEGSVKSRLFYARENLKKLLDPVLGEHNHPDRKETHVL